MDPITIASLLALGAIVGLLVGLTSVGSGALMTPILLLDFTNVVGKIFVVGTATTQGTVSKMIVSLRNYRKKKLNNDYIFIISLAGIPTAAIGAFYSSTLISWNLFPPILAAVLALTGILIIGMLRFEKINLGKDPKVTSELRVKGIVIGLVVGLIAGLTGVSTGSILVASLILILKFPTKTAVNIAIFEGGIILLAATLAQLYLGHVNFLVTGLLLVGGVPAMLVGNNFKDRVNQKKLGYLVALVIIFESARTLSSFFFGKSFFFF